jgi:hypothetical protein
LKLYRKLFSLEDIFRKKQGVKAFPNKMKWIDRVEHSTWFQLAAEGARATRSADCPHVKTVSSFKHGYKTTKPD